MTFQSRWPDDLFRAFFGGVPSARSAGVFPPVNLFDDGNAFLVRAELPGVEKDSIEITAQGDQLTLRGERKIEPANAGASYHRRECEGGQFRRSVTLPMAVDASAIEATYKNGVLEVVLPRAPEARPRKINVN